MIGTGRVCETSASRAPRVITVPTPSLWAAPAIESAKVRQRRLGSVPSSSRRSRLALGARAARRMFSGHSMLRVCPSVRVIVGRLAWKSKNSSGSSWATTSASSEPATASRAVDAAAAASFQPRNAQTRTGARSFGGSSSSQTSGSTA